MNVTKTFLVSAIGLVLTLVIIGIGVGVYRSVKPIADTASEGVNTLAGELTSDWYKYNGKIMTGAQITADTKLTGSGKLAGVTSGWGSTTTYALTVNWDSGTNTLKSIDIKKVNQ